MKKLKVIFLPIFICVCMFFGGRNVKAYIVGENEPQIAGVEFWENRKILKTSDTLHIRLKTENIDCATYYKCRVLFTAHVLNRVDDITVECTYNPSTGYYQGESIPISKEEMGETEYTASFYGFYNKSPGIYGEVLTYPILSFVYSDNCYAGVHTGGTPTCSEKARCSVCGNEYGAMLPHKPGEWKVITDSRCTEPGKKEKRCVECNLVLSQESIAPRGHVPGKVATCENPQECKVCHKILKPATGHTIGNWKVVKRASCISCGKETKECEKCHTLIETRVTAKLSHKAGKWKIIKASSGTKTGLKQKKCALCGKIIEKATIPKTRIKLNASSIPIQLKKSSTALKVISVSNGDSVKSWNSSNKKIVSVNSKTGKITAKKVGKAKITVTTKTGAKATCIVTVQKSAVKTRKLSVQSKSITMNRGKSYSIKINRYPITANDKVTYKTSNKNIATVSSSGKIVAKKKGSATITIKAGSTMIGIKVYVK